MSSTPPAAAEREKASVEKRESVGTQSLREHAGNSTENVNAKLANPLAGLSHEQVMNDAEAFAVSHDLSDFVADFRKGGLVAKDPTAFRDLPQLDDDDKTILERELTHRWDHPTTLYYLVILCSVAAAVQGVCSRSSFVILHMI
jgi:hypothetical protein